MKYTVIAPAYNEEGNVEPLVTRITDAMEKVDGDYEIIIVDDGSTDGTFEKLKSINKKLKVISLAENSGQTVAFQAGFDYATGERIVTLDSDLEKDPAYIPEMIKKLDNENLDLVYFKKLYTDDIPFLRRIASKIANLFRNAITGDKAVDVGSTFKVYRRNVFKGRNFSSGFHRYFIGFMEAEGFSMGYVEGPVYNRPTGNTKYTNWGRLKQGLADLFYFYLYKNKKICIHKLIFSALAVVGIVWIGPFGVWAKSVTLFLFITMLALLLSLTIHATHLLVRSRKVPYVVKDVYTSLKPEKPADHA